MNPTADEEDETFSDLSGSEAALWVVRLHGPKRNAAMEAGWRRWLAADPKNMRAWERASDVWAAAQEIPGELLRPPLVAKPRWFRHKRLAAAAVGVFGFVLGAWALHLFGQSAVVTGVGEQKTLNLADGTQIELNTNTQLTVQYDRRVRKIVLQSGEAYFSVTHDERPFIVVSGGHEVVALGTAFVVRQDQRTDDWWAVTLVEGRVAVGPANSSISLPTKPTTNVTILNAGQRLRVRPNQPSAVDSPPIERALSWRTGKVVFDHTSLELAAKELNRYSTQRITVDPAVAHIPIDGIFRVGASASFVRAVSQDYDLRLILNGDEMRIEPHANTP